MSIDLAFLVTDRAPLGGIDFRVLFYLAVLADEYDLVTIHPAAAARATRMNKRDAARALTRLTASGHLVRMPGHDRYAIARELLVVCASRNPQQRSFAGIRTNRIRKATRERLESIVEERASMLRQALDLPVPSFELISECSVLGTVRLER